MGTIGFPKNKKNKFAQNTGNRTVQFLEFCVEHREIQKFLEDKAFCNSEEVIILTEGVILNKHILLSKYKCVDIHELCLKLYNIEGDTFFKLFKGSFSGIIHNKTDNSTILFTDQIGDRLLYYGEKNGGIIFGSELNSIADRLRQDKISYKFNRTAAYSLLTYAYLIDDLTIIEGIRKLKPGEMLIIKAGKMEIQQYHQFSMSSENSKIKLSDAIEGIDHYFRKAILLQINKNKEYNYENFASLSAGLDSRMTVWLATELSNQPLINFTYSETGFYDEIVPKKIADKLGNHYLFKALDNGLSLFLIDDCTKINDGIVTNYGPAQVLDILKFLNKEELGLIHTGMLGDKIIGSWSNSKSINRKYKIGEGAYSTRLLRKFVKLYGIEIFDSYENIEIGMLYTRGFSGANRGAPLVFQKYAESFSPFYDNDFIKFCYSLPIDMRYGHKLYYKWVTSKYPEAAKFHHNGSKILDHASLFSYKGVSYGTKDFARKVMNKSLRRLGLRNSEFNTRKGMNPLGYWYNTNIQLKKFMDDYFSQNINMIEDIELKEDCKVLYFEGSPVEQNMVLSLLSANKLFFNDN